MRIEIYNEKTAEVEPVVRLAVVREYGNVYLAAVDERGEILPSGRLLQIHEDGTFRRANSIGECLGLKLDAIGRVVIVGGDD